MNNGWKKKWIYAMYKGEELLCIGTRDEICEKMNIKPDTFHYYRTKTYKNLNKRRKEYSKGRRTIVRLEDD